MEQEVERPSAEGDLGEGAGSDASADPTNGLAEADSQELSVSAPHALPIVREELSLLQVVLKKLDGATRRSRIAVDDAGALIELRDALAEAKPEDQGSLLEQMHRIEALSRQRGKGDSPPVDRKSPYFGHMRLEEGGRRRDVLIGQRGYVEPGGGVQIVDWRNAPVSRLFYRYEEGDLYEEQLGDRMVEGEIIARRTVTIVNSELRRVSSAQGTFARELATGQWREVNVRQAKLSVARDGSVTVHSEAPAGVLPAMPAAQAKAARQANRGRLGMDAGQARVDRFLPAIAALIDPRQFELITRPTSGLIVVQGSAGSGKTTIGLHRIAYLAFADPQAVQARADAGGGLPAGAGHLRVPGAAVAGRPRRAGDDVLRLGRGTAQGHVLVAGHGDHRRHAICRGAGQVARGDAEDPRGPAGGDRRVVPGAAGRGGRRPGR